MMGCFRLVRVLMGCLRPVRVRRRRLARGWMLLRLLTVMVLRLSPGSAAECNGAQHPQYRLRRRQCVAP
jgi:hypothetical protein